MRKTESGLKSKDYCFKVLPECLSLINLIFLILLIFESCSISNLKTKQQDDLNTFGEIRLFVDPNWVSEDPEKQFAYGLMVQSPWNEKGRLFLHFPEHLEYNPLGNTILRHWDKIQLPWIISPDKKQASYRVESLALKNVYVESFARVLSEGELPFDASCVKLAMKIENSGTDTLPVVRPLICLQYNGLFDFPNRLDENYQHNFIVIEGKVTALADLPTKEINTTFKGCEVKGCPQHDTRSEEFGGLINEKMDLALSIVNSVDNRKKIIYWWTPGKSMIANARIPCIHADPYFGTILPGETSFAEGYIFFTEGPIEPIIEYLKEMDRKIF